MQTRQSKLRESESTWKSDDHIKHLRDIFENRTANFNLGASDKKPAVDDENVMLRPKQSAVLSYAISKSLIAGAIWLIAIMLLLFTPFDTLFNEEPTPPEVLLTFDKIFAGCLTIFATGIIMGLLLR